MSTRTRIRIAVLILASILSCAARADSLLVGQRQWSNVKIQWFQDGKVRFTAADGSQQAVPIVTVTRLQVDLRDNLNRAEELRLDEKNAEALSAYEAALRIENRNDLGGFIRYRLMDLYGRSGQLDHAVEMYLDLIKIPDFYTVVNDWRPTNMASVKPKVREAALTALDDGLRQIRSGLPSESIRQLKDFIQSAKVTPPGEAVEAARPSTAAGASPAAPGAPSAPAAATPGDAVPGSEFAPLPDLAEPGPAFKALQAKQYSEALQLANQALAQPDLSRDLLPEALYVRGVAQWQLAKDPARYLQAGWALSRMLVEFPADPRAAECLYYLGLVHQRLGKTDMARQLLQQALQTAGTKDLRDRVDKALREVVEKG